MSDTKTVTPAPQLEESSMSLKIHFEPIKLESSDAKEVLITDLEVRDHAHKRATNAYKWASIMATLSSTIIVVVSLIS